MYLFKSFVNICNEIVTIRPTKKRSSVIYWKRDILPPNFSHISAISKFKSAGLNSVNKKLFQVLHVISFTTNLKMFTASNILRSFAYEI